MKRVVAAIFLLIFSFQIIPVKEIGEILFKGQITEEETHACNNKGNESKLGKFNNYLDLDFLESQNSCIAHYNHSLSVAFAVADNLPIGFIPDIATPPPNC